MNARTTATYPARRTCPFSPPPEYKQLREEAPVSRVSLPDDNSAWAVSRHEDVRTVLADPRFSSDRAHPGFPVLAPGQRQPSTKMRPSLISMDPPEHGEARREVVGEFTVRRMQKLQPRLQEIVDQHIDAILAGPRPVDLVPTLALPVPSLVICELLGVPYADHDFFQSRSSHLLLRTAPMEEREKARDELRVYLEELVTAKVAAPTDDLLSRQIAKQPEITPERHEDLVGMAFLLLVAGHETTANMISLGTLTLLRNPESAQAMRDDPSKTLGAVEELLRYYTIAEIATARVAVEDVEIGGVLIKAGEGVVALSNSGNHDPESFENPDVFDIERSARHHVAFGFGVHQCLGQNLARLELQIVFDTLLRRIPELKLAVPEDELSFKDDSSLYGLHELPVTW